MTDERVERLTDREVQILQRAASGMRTTEIAQSLGLHPSTVVSYRHNILRTLGVHTITEAVVIAIRAGRIE